MDDINKSQETFNYLCEFLGEVQAYQLFDALCRGAIPYVSGEWMGKKLEEKEEFKW